MPILPNHFCEIGGGAVVITRAFFGYSACESASLPKLIIFGIFTVCIFWGIFLPTYILQDDITSPIILDAKCDVMSLRSCAGQTYIRSNPVIPFSTTFLSA